MRRFLLMIFLTFVIAACQTTTPSAVETSRDLLPRRVSVNSGDGTPLNAYLYRTRWRRLPARAFFWNTTMYLEDPDRLLCRPP
jgi:hypothetical protein